MAELPTVLFVVELERRFQLAVERVVERLVDINWAITGSVGHRLQGVDVECGDVDIQTDEAGAYAAGRALSEFVVEPVRFRRTRTLTSHFGQFRFVDFDVDVEVMGAIDKRLADGSWTGSTDPSEHLVEVTMGVLRVPVMSVDYEARAYEAMGRLERARLLRQLL